MVKLLFFCRRRPALSHNAYAARLLDGHVPLALRHHPTMRRYTVNVVEHVPAGAEPLDSIGELGFDTLADFRDRLYDSPDGRAAVERDVAGFIGSAHGYAVTEHVQKAEAKPAVSGARSPGMKLVCPLVRRPDLTHEAFVAHWLARHVPLALAHHPALTRYVTNVVDARLSDAAEPLDGVAELHFASAEAVAGGLFDSPEGERVVRADIAQFIGRVVGYPVAEYVRKIES
jgi:uncharacterized protein (TIGR02118 family)